MFNGPRTIFSYISLRKPDGMMVHLLYDFVYKMEERMGQGTVEENGVAVQKTVSVTVVFSPFGDQTIVLDKPEDIVKQLEKAGDDAIKSAAERFSGQVLQVPAGAIDPATVRRGAKR
jgi:hypothetical protein